MGFSALRGEPHPVFSCVMLLIGKTVSSSSIVRGSDRQRITKATKYTPADFCSAGRFQTWQGRTKGSGADEASGPRRGLGYARIRIQVEKPAAQGARWPAPTRTFLLLPDSK